MLWAEADPGRDLELAAQTEEEPGDPTRLATLPGGELELRLYPGLEGGVLRLARARPEPDVWSEG